MSVEITILCENSVVKSLPVIGEHGFSCFIETPGGNYLFDTGWGLGIDNNAKVLEKDLSTARAMILSHGHCDHTGGLEKALKMTGPIDVHAHPEVFSQHCTERGGGRPRFIGIPFRQEYLEALGANFKFDKEFRQIGDGVYVTGEVPRKWPEYEIDDAALYVIDENGQKIFPDPIIDDQSMVIETPAGLVVVLGCAHAGIINILDYIMEKMGTQRIHAVLGGTHLGPADKERSDAIIKKLLDYDIERLGLSHCTSLVKGVEIAKYFEGKFFFSSLGSVFKA